MEPTTLRSQRQNRVFFWAIKTVVGHDEETNFSCQNFQQNLHSLRIEGKNKPHLVDRNIPRDINNKTPAKPLNPYSNLRTRNIPRRGKIRVELAFFNVEEKERVWEVIEKLMRESLSPLFLWYFPTNSLFYIFLTSYVFPFIYFPKSRIFYVFPKSMAVWMIYIYTCIRSVRDI